jgi:hypothetical protein
MVPEPAELAALPRAPDSILRALPFHLDRLMHNIMNTTRTT